MTSPALFDPVTPTVSDMLKQLDCAPSMVIVSLVAIFDTTFQARFKRLLIRVQNINAAFGKEAAAVRALGMGIEHHKVSVPGIKIDRAA